MLFSNTYFSSEFIFSFSALKKHTSLHLMPKIICRYSEHNVFRLFRWRAIVVGGEPHHLLPGVSGAAGGGGPSGGAIGGGLCEGVSCRLRGGRAAPTGEHGGWRGQPGPQRPAAARAPLRQLRRANRTLWPGHWHHHDRYGEHFHLNGGCRWDYPQPIVSENVAKFLQCDW